MRFCRNRKLRLNLKKTQSSQTSHANYLSARFSLMKIPFAILALAAAALADDPGILKTEFIYETAPFPQCHASTIVETKAGLVTAWFGGTTEKNRDVGIWSSRNIDGKWTAPV